MKKRGFEVAKGFEKDGIELPVQSTQTSAGFDFEAAEDTTIQPFWKEFSRNFAKAVSFVEKQTDEQKSLLTKLLKPTLVKTGIKAYMGEEEFLGLYNRSSNPMKKLLLMTNGVGIVDSDYYENPDNDGHIMFQYINFGFFPVHIKKGEKVGQGIFQPYLKADEGKARVLGEERVGGFGSTTKPEYTEAKFSEGEEVYFVNHPYTLIYNYGTIDLVETENGQNVYYASPYQYPDESALRFYENQLARRS